MKAFNRDYLKTALTVEVPSRCDRNVGKSTMRASICLIIAVAAFLGLAQAPAWAQDVPQWGRFEKEVVTVVVNL